MTLNTTSLGASSPLPEGGKSLRIPIERPSYDIRKPPLSSNVLPLGWSERHSEHKYEGGQIVCHIRMAQSYLARVAFERQLAYQSGVN
jgi:hypothetical protein